MPCSALCLFVLCTLAQGDLHSQEREKPAIKVSFPNYTFERPLTSLSQLDPKNDDGIVFGDKDMPEFRAHLRHGIYERRTKIGGDWLKFRWVKGVQDDSATSNYAVAYYVWDTWAGSSSDVGVVQLLHAEESGVKVLQQILFNLRGSQKAFASFDAKSNSLTIRGVNAWEHCCPTGLDVVEFRLKEGFLKPVHYGNAPLE
jgi:hypothetical protein